MIAQDTAQAHGRSCDHTTLVTDPFLLGPQTSLPFYSRASCLPWFLYLLQRAMFGAELKAHPLVTTLPFMSVVTLG